MLSNTPVERVYLACGITDHLKSIYGPSVNVQEYFHLDPFSSSLFVFRNRKRDKFKILHWDNAGFWLYYRRLEQGTFHWPLEYHGTTMHVSQRQLRWLLDGLQVEQRQAHQGVSACTII